MSILGPIDKDRLTRWLVLGILSTYKMSFIYHSIINSIIVYYLMQINLMFLPYQSDDPENCEKHGSRYSMSNCVFEAAFEVSQIGARVKLIHSL